MPKFQRNKNTSRIFQKCYNRRKRKKNGENRQFVGENEVLFSTGCNLKKNFVIKTVIICNFPIDEMKFLGYNAAMDEEPSRTNLTRLTFQKNVLFH